MRAYKRETGAVVMTLYPQAIAALMLGATSILPGMAQAQTAPKTAADWVGPYVGANFGVTVDSQTPNDPNLPFGGVTGPYFTINGGYNFAFRTFLVGLEAEFGPGFQKDTTRVGPPFNTDVESKVRFKGFIGPRVGIPVGPVLPYVKGGFAFGNTEVKIAANGAKDSATQTGYFIGGGIEYPLGESFSLKAEYRYVDLSRERFFNGARFGYNGSDIALGVNFRF
jgi:opacity protein-like surface antigen